MSTILLIGLFSLLCLAQWYFSKNNLQLFRYLPTGLYLLITGIASIKTVANGTFSLQAAAMLTAALATMLLLDRLARLLKKNEQSTLGTVNNICENMDLVS